MFLVYLLGVVLFFSFLANFAFRKIFKSLSWVDRPDGVKKLHKNDIPLSGGISFITSLIFAVLIFDFFAGVNFNLSWNGFFVSDYLKQEDSQNQNLDKRIDLIGNDSFEIEVVDVNENSQAVVVINKKTFETELMEVYRDESAGGLPGGGARRASAGSDRGEGAHRSRRGGWCSADCGGAAASSAHRGVSQGQRRRSAAAEDQAGDLRRREV